MRLWWGSLTSSFVPSPLWREGREVWGGHRSGRCPASGPLRDALGAGTHGLRRLPLPEQARERGRPPRAFATTVCLTVTDEGRSRVTSAAGVGTGGGAGAEGGSGTRVRARIQASVWTLLPREARLPAHPQERQRRLVPSSLEKRDRHVGCTTYKRL